MAVPCRKLCLAYKATRQGHGSYYGSGHKRCNECELFLKWPSPKCSVLQPGVEDEAAQSSNQTAAEAPRLATFRTCAPGAGTS